MHAGHALRFNGTGSGDVDRVKIRVDDPATSAPGPSANVGATDFTIELWLKTAVGNNAPAVTCGANANWINGNMVVDRDRYNQDRKFGVSIAGGRIVFGVAGDGTGDRTLCGTTTVTDGTWHHVAVQRRRSDGWMWIFVDGNLDAQVDGPDGDISYPANGVPGNFCGGPCTNSDPFLVLGAEKHDAGAAFPSYFGWLDEMRISRTLRYAANFSRPRAPFVRDGATVTLHHFDEGFGSVALRHGDRAARTEPRDRAARDARRAFRSGRPTRRSTPRHSRSRPARCSSCRTYRASPIRSTSSPRPTAPAASWSSSRVASCAWCRAPPSCRSRFSISRRAPPAAASAACCRSRSIRATRPTAGCSRSTRAIPTARWCSSGSIAIRPTPTARCCRAARCC